MTCFRKGGKAVLCALFLLISTYAATTKYGGSYFFVSPSGDDNNDGKSIDKAVKTLEHAAKLLQPGDILQLRGGIYQDDQFLTAVAGTADRPITVTAYPGETPIITGRPQWQASAAVSHPFYMFDGLTFQDKSNPGYMMWIHDTNHVTVRNCTFRNSPYDLTLVAVSSDVTFENNTFDTAGDPGGTGFGEHIYINGSSRVLVQNNKMTRAGHASVSVVDDRSGAISSNVIIRNNVIEQHWGGGIYVQNRAHDNVIENNQISYAGEVDTYTKGGIAISCPSNIVRRNIITRTGSSAQPGDNGLDIYAWDDGNGVLQNSLDNRVYNNVVYKSAHRGLSFVLRGQSVLSRNKLLNNVFYANKQQVCTEYECMQPGEFNVDDYHSTNKWPSFPNDNYFINNLFLGQKGGVDAPGGQIMAYTWYKTLADVQADYPAYFKGNLEANPKFTNADGGVFTLQPGSPLIDAGAHFTRTVSAGSNTTTVQVDDARYFTDGFGMIPGDMVRIGSNAPVAVIKVDIGSGTLTLASPVSFNNGDYVDLPYSGNAPDIGAIEFAGASLSVVSGTPQSTPAGSQFPLALQVRVADAQSAPVAGVLVNFTSNGSGAGSTFSGAPYAYATTDSNGLASLNASANGTPGSYTVTASAQGYGTVSFSLTNTAAVQTPGALAIAGGNGQAATAGANFAAPLSVTLTDTTGKPIASAAVTFTAPPAGPSAAFGSQTSVTVNTNANGVATSPQLAANTKNGVYLILASSAGVQPVAFSLTNTAAVQNPGALVIAGGTPQSATLNTAFASPLAVRLTDTGSKPMSGVPVTFTAPSGGASALFGNQTSTTVFTDPNGVASAPALIANGNPGSYAVSASVAGLPAVAFSLTNVASAPQPPVTGNDVTLFGSTTPAADFNPATYSLEMGVKFRSDVAGTIKGIRFYKDARDNGLHVGSLWSSSGQLLATGTFTNETGSGWQQLTFAAPVQIAANTTYVASYNSKSGYRYAYGYFNNGVDAPPLHALKSGVDGDNGICSFGDAPTFPRLSIAQVNFFVDVVFNSGKAPDPPVVPTPNTMTVVNGTSQSATVNTSFASVLSVKVMAGSTPVSGVPVTFAAPSNGGASASFTGTGATTIAVTDSNGIAVTPVVAANGVAGSYTVSATAPGLQAVVFSLTNNSPAVQPGGDVTLFGSAPPSANFLRLSYPVEVGVKFRSDVAGMVKGIRFYKNSADNGPHVGSLWTASGQLLATGTFTNESGSGWQQMMFSSPVQIAPNTTYIASYNSTSGLEIAYHSFGANGVDAPPLHALKSGVDGDNGVYAYGAAPNFPDVGVMEVNFFVDLVFAPMQ